MRRSCLAGALAHWSLLFVRPLPNQARWLIIELAEAALSLPPLPIGVFYWLNSLEAESLPSSA